MKTDISKLKFEDLINRLPKSLVQKLKDTNQDKKWHSEGSAYNHIKMVFDETVKTGDIDLIVTAIFHDLGKVDTHKETIKDGRVKISHIGHEYKSLNYIDKYFYLYHDLSENKEKTIEITKNHMRCHLYTSNTMKKAAKRKAFEDNPYFNDIIKFTECDEKGRIPGE
jgi:hypothetical protein